MPKPTHFRILLVQAGGTEWDRDGRLSGDADLPLSGPERARLEALQPADWTPHGAENRPELDIILTGPDEASQATASLASAAYAGVKVKKVAGLKDLDLGLWEGVLPEDLQDRCPTSFKQWQEDPGSVTAPEGESLTGAVDRVLAEIRKAADRTKRENPAVGVVLRPVAYAAVRCWLEALPTTQMRGVLGEDAAEPRLFEVERARFEHVGSPTKG